MRGFMRLVTPVVLLAIQAAVAPVRGDEQAAVATVRGDDLATKLTALEGEPLDLVELGTGKRFVRPLLEKVVARNGVVTSLRLKPEGEPRGATVLLQGIVRIVADRETIYEAEVKGKSVAQIRSKRAREAYEKQQLASRERMEKRGVSPWPTLSAEEHAQEVADLKAFVAEVREAFPALRTTETHEFIVATDIPAAQMGPYVASLDSMHDFLCDLYGIPRGEPVWKGKCLVIAFLQEADFVAFEARFMKAPLQGVHGVCHQRSDGRVVMACYRGDDAPAFAHMLVHETSHGFNHRWMSPQRIPNWLNEGIAEWVGLKVVPGSNQVALKEAAAVQYMQTRGDLGPEFFAAQNIEAIQYGMASGLVKFLTARDQKKFAAFVQAIKEGVPVEDALQDAFNASLDDLVKAYGAAVGVPALKR
jgi:hypothetical protein